MEVTFELIGTAAVGLLVIVTAIGNYLKTKQAAPKPDPVITGIGLAFGDREQTERLLKIVDRLAAAAETIADKRQENIEDMLAALLKQLQQTERANESRQRQRRPPP